MNKQFKENHRTSFIVSAGWLFADMLLAIAMLFLAANTVGIHPPPPAPTPHPYAKATPKVKPTPTPLPRLELAYHRFQINIDPDGLLSGSKNANDSAVQQVKSQGFLNGRRAGLIIVYGGAPDDSQIASAQAVANNIYDLLRNLGKQGDSRFSSASYYNQLYNLGTSRNIVEIDVYLFAK